MEVVEVMKSMQSVLDVVRKELHEVQDGIEIFGDSFGKAAVN